MSVKRIFPMRIRHVMSQLPAEMRDRLKERYEDEKSEYSPLAEEFNEFMENNAIPLRTQDKIWQIINECVVIEVDKNKLRKLIESVS